MRSKKFLNLFFSLIILFSFVPLFLFSQNTEKLKPDAPPEEYLCWLYKVLIVVGGAAAVLGLVIAGFKFITSIGDPSRLADARDQAIKALTGLVIITLLPTILGTIDPNLSIANIFKAPGAIPEKKATEIPLGKPDGVYIKTIDMKEEQYLAQSYSQLPSRLNKKINYVKVIGSFRAVLFDEINFKGYCLEVSEGSWSIPSPSASSIMVCPIKATTGSVTFYRKAFYDETGGTLTEGVTNWEYLKNLKFNNVPEVEKKCIKWNEDGSCKTKEEPTLKETTSIKIEGNLSVLLVAERKGEKEEKEGTKGPYCQLFYDKGGKYSVANLKNEYIRAKNREPYVMKILPGTPP